VSWSRRRNFTSSLPQIMSESIDNNSHKLPPQQLQEHALAIKRSIIDAWISDLPQTPPTPESFSPTPAHPRRGQRQGSCKPRGNMEEGDAELPRRSKRVLPSLKDFEPPMRSTRQKISQSPTKKQQPVTKTRGRRGKISQPQPLLGGGAPSTAALSYQQRLGSTTLAVETTLNTTETQTSETRGTSPTRTRKDLESAVPKIICCEFNDDIAADMREDVQSLREELMEAARHRGILPLSLRDTLFKLLKKWDQDDAYFGEYPRSKEEEDIIWIAIQDIRVDAKTCGEQNKPESSWCNEVIRPLIKNALKYTPWQNRVRVEIV